VERDAQPRGVRGLGRVAGGATDGLDLAEDIDREAGDHQQVNGRPGKDPDIIGHP
jgi:hypothetical protein